MHVQAGFARVDLWRLREAGALQFAVPRGRQQGLIEEFT